MDSASPEYTDGTPRGLGAGNLPKVGDHGARMLPPPSLFEAPPGTRDSSRRDFNHPSQHERHTLPGLIQVASHGSGSSTNFNQRAPERDSGNPLSHQNGLNSPSIRQDIRLSTSTNATTITNNHSPTSAETTTTAQATAGPSPTTVAGGQVSSADDPDAGEGKRMNRCRQGPLGPWQRQKAHLMRVLGACPPCKGSRTSCQPSHYGLEYDDAVRKYLGESPAPSPPPPQNTTMPSPDRAAYPPPPLNTDQKRSLQELEKDISPTSTSAQQPPRKSRKPLPGGPSRRLEKAAQDALSLPRGPVWSVKPRRPSRTPPRTNGYSPTNECSPSNGYSPTTNGYSPKHNYSQSQEPVKTSGSATMSVSNLLGLGSNVSATAGRYDSVYVKMLCWEDEDLHDVKRTMDGLRMVLEHHYHYSCEIDLIPSASSSMWLVGKLQRFFSYQDQPNVLKVFYYNGHSFMNRDLEQVLTRYVDCHDSSEPSEYRCTKAVVLTHHSSSTSSATHAIKWSVVQSILEATVSDTLVLLDCPYFGGRVNKHRGNLTILASCDFADYAPHSVPRGLFTHCLAENLRKRAIQTFRGRTRINDLHIDIMCDYKICIPDARTDHEFLVRFPRPFYIQYSGPDAVGDGAILLVPATVGGSMSVASNDNGNTATGRVALEISFDASVTSQEELSRMIRQLPGVGDVRVGG